MAFFDQKHGLTRLENCDFWVFKILKDFASKHDLKVCPFSFYGLLSVSKEIRKMLPILLRQETRTLRK